MYAFDYYILLHSFIYTHISLFIVFSAIFETVT